MMRHLDLEHLGLEVLGVIDGDILLGDKEDHLVIGIPKLDRGDPLSEVYIETEECKWYCNEDDTNWELLI